ncbi:MAG: hypothetical protein ACR2RV_18310 [Verrucomicrobiales bacterium]
MVRSIEGYVDRCLAACHPKVLEWQGHSATRGRLESWLQSYLARLGDPAVLENFAHHCPVEGAIPADYAVRTLPLDKIGTLLAGIHFYGGDASMPFVHVTAKDFELDRAVIGSVAQLLSREFALFRPRRFRIWLNSQDEDLFQAPGAEVDQWVLAGWRDEIRRRPMPAPWRRVSLVPDPGLDSYSEFERCYREFNEQHPGTEAWNTAVGRDTLERCAADGGNFRVHIDGEPAGWIAAWLSGEGPLFGWTMADELLEAEQRGRGFAAAMQRVFLEALPAGEELVFGTIDQRNAASLGTARRVGREIVGGYLFLPMAGHG